MQTDNDQVLVKPLFVVGAPRSGTTLLLRTLSTHSDLAWFGEPRLIWRYGNDHKSDMLRPEDARPQVIRHIRARFAEGTWEQGKTRFLEKLPSNSLRLGFMDRVFPDGRFIHIIRNPIDSVISIRSFWEGYATGSGGNVRRRMGMHRKQIRWRQVPYYLPEIFRRFAPHSLRWLVGRNVWGPRLPGMRQMLRELDLLEIGALQWRMCVEAACQYGRKLPPDRYFECRIEDLNETLVEQLVHFAELGDDPQVLEYFRQNFQPDQSGRRKQEADPAEIDRIRQWTEPTMQWLGYSLS